MSISFGDNTVLIEHLQKGNESAYVYLVNTYYTSLFTYAASLTRNYAVAEDIVQNVFLKTWQNRTQLNPEYSVKSFLYKITYNEFVNQYNRTRTFSALDNAHSEALAEVIDDHYTELLKEKIAIVNKGVDQLPDKCKETFLLSKKEGLTNTEISAYLNVSVKTVEGQLTRAYNLLREMVGKQLRDLF